jgi:predicted O-linked N-acetylglucosamine transferase (SPINDLY family)
MIDPYPFGGGVTTLEALAVCTPVLTLPSRQTVLTLTAGMIRGMYIYMYICIYVYMYTHTCVFNHI